MVTTASITGGPGKGARVIVTGRTSPGFRHVEFPQADGPYGRNLWVREGALADFQEEETVARAPKPAPLPLPTRLIVDPVPGLVLVESPELVEARMELARLEKGLVDNFNAVAGGRGKQGLQRTNAQIRRGAIFAEKVKVARVWVETLLAATERKARPVTPELLRSAVAVKTRFGWHRVVRVNVKTVTVATPYSWTDRIAVGQIVDVR